MMNCYIQWILQEMMRRLRPHGVKYEFLYFWSLLLDIKNNKTVWQITCRCELKLHLRSCHSVWLGFRLGHCLENFRPHLHFKRWVWFCKPKCTFSFRNVWYRAEFMGNHTEPEVSQCPHTVTQPPPCFIVLCGMLCSIWYRCNTAHIVHFYLISPLSQKAWGPLFFLFLFLPSKVFYLATLPWIHGSLLIITSLNSLTVRVLPIRRRWAV